MEMLPVVVFILACVCASDVQAIPEGHEAWVDWNPHTFNGEERMQPQDAVAPIDPSGCNKTKGCLHNPPGCDMESCNAFITWTPNAAGEYIDFEMSGVAEGWVGVGLSSDKKMGGTSVMYCVKNDTGIVTAMSSYNTGYENAPLSPPDAGLSNIKGYYIDGQVRCTFRRAYTVVGEDKVYNASQPHYLIAGFGPSSGGFAQKHLVDPIVTHEKVTLTNVTSGEMGVDNKLIKVHACLMIVSWVMCTGLGLVLARFYKRAWPGTMHCGKPIWMTYHRLMMLFVMFCTAAAFIVIFVEGHGYSNTSGWSTFQKVHPILGIIVTSLVILNPIMAAFRCDPGEDKRPIFNWAHGIVGAAAHIGGVICIFFGFYQQKAKTFVPNWLIWLMVAYSALHVLVYILLTINKCCLDRQEQQWEKEQEDREALEMSASDPPGEPNCFQYLVLGVYSCGAIGLATAMIVIIVLEYDAMTKL